MSNLHDRQNGDQPIEIDLDEVDDVGLPLVPEGQAARALRATKQPDEPIE